MKPRIIVTRIKPASFKCKHNATKSKCLIMLEYSATSKEQEHWHTARQLSYLTGISYGSILASLPKWVRWRIVIRKKAKLANGREVYIYQAATKGRAWLWRHKWHMPLERYQAEVLQATGRSDGLLS
jgi:DNA-binding PadR family transcriptional regulator